MANVQAAVAEVNPEIGIQLRVLTQRIKDTLLGDRLMAMLSGAFGLLADRLATLGLDGVISYMVAQQRNEIGLRMALGADRGSVIGLVMREAGFLLMIGLIAERPWRFERRVPPPLCYSASDPTTRDACLRVRGAGLRRHGGRLCAGGLRIPPRSDASLARGIGILEQ